MKKALNPTPQPKQGKPYNPAPHPMQARLDTYRAVPSLVTAPTYIPQGK